MVWCRSKRLKADFWMSLFSFVDLKESYTFDKNIKFCSLLQNYRLNYELAKLLKDGYKIIIRFSSGQNIFRTFIAYDKNRRL